MSARTDVDPDLLIPRIRAWGSELGFQQIGISDVSLVEDEARLQAWLERGWHGEMSYMSKHGAKRSRPALLIPRTLSVIVARMNYLPEPNEQAREALADESRAYVSRYALGRDYHKLMRARLQGLASRVAGEIGDYGYRVFTDSAPVLERALARKGGLGWVGKHANLINRADGSWFFLGEIYTDLALPADPAYATEHCGTCVACLDACPTGAIVAPYEVDARRCISYLTIELKGPIPEDLRPLIGNRVFGCDDCQLVCPWNRYASLAAEQDFAPRHRLDNSSLLELFAWSPEEFDARTRGSAIRRISFEQWSRNIAVALGNAPPSQAIIDALRARLAGASALVREHLEWALARQTGATDPGV
jgi:epoxyqueuosine reductase